MLYRIALTPATTKIVVFDVGLVVTYEQIAIESQWIHRRIRKTAIDPMSLYKGIFTFQYSEKTQKFSRSDFFVKKAFLGKIFVTLPC